MEITVAVVKEKGSTFELNKVTLNEPGAEEVMVKIVATGICHTDMVAPDFFYGLS